MASRSERARERAMTKADFGAREWARMWLVDYVIDRESNQRRHGGGAKPREATKSASVADSLQRLTTAYMTVLALAQRQ